jgi:hypothetical protein
MASFTIEHQTQLSKEQAYKKIKSYFEGSEGLRKLDDSLKLTFDDPSHTGKIKGSKFEGDFKVTGQDAAKVSFTVSLSFFLTPFKGKIQETLESKIRQVLS